ncbi:hypothetical protein OPU71_02305 [Niveibacterium sp. 24ML]|uniref:hypothetical protein n=1 Tax=Niveibacterium sp. 24ML TaxID=2985512 RepID=UPI00226EE6E8|nr:hypothetical protein [Niveibacterium sp. 24ML]MCX9154952.1 hypothetical protein [Niveibacterium sp. 24ML]
MNKPIPVAWYWSGVGRRVELQRPSASNSANWKPLYLVQDSSREAQLESAVSEALEALQALGDGSRVRKTELAHVTERLRQVLAPGAAR